MRVGIIFAMEEELRAFKEKVNVVNEKKIYDLTFYQALVNDIDVILVLSGVGKVNAARTTQVLIDFMNVNYVFNVGVAGSVSKSLDICDIVIGSSVVQHDFNLKAFNRNRGEIPDIGTFIDSDEYLINISLKSLNGAKKGVIASGDIFCNDLIMKEKINKEFNALCVEMEGASIAQVCYLSKVPFVIIRSISDSLNGNEMEYDKFLNESSNKVVEGIYKILLSLNKK